jgi:hypothetical protein
MPKIEKPPMLPNKLDTQTDALRNLMQRRQGMVSASSTNVTGGNAGAAATAAPMAGGARTILGG